MRTTRTAVRTYQYLSEIVFTAATLVVRVRSSSAVLPVLIAPGPGSGTSTRTTAAVVVHSRRGPYGITIAIARTKIRRVSTIRLAMFRSIVLSAEIRPLQRVKEEEAPGSSD